MAEGRRVTGRPISARRRRDEAVEVGKVDTAETAEVVEAASRFAQLREAVTGLRTRAAGADVERWMLIMGAILVPSGLIAIVLGWQGAADTPYEFEQTPYVISGGLLGVGLITLGGFLYFGYWLTRMVRRQQEDADRMAEALGRIEELLGGGVKTNGAARRVPSASSARRTGPPTRAAFVATAGGSMFHRPDCVVVEGKSGLRRVTGRDRGMEPCGICDPLTAA